MDLDVRLKMKVALQILAVLAAMWAIISPAGYGLLFGVFLSWVAIVDMLVAASCVVLAYSMFRGIPAFLNLFAFGVLALFCFLDLFRHFRDSGESGPLPFEWINGYFWQALPLIIVVIISTLMKNFTQGNSSPSSTRLSTCRTKRSTQI